MATTYMHFCYNNNVIITCNRAISQQGNIYAKLRHHACALKSTTM